MTGSTSKEQSIVDAHCTDFRSIIGVEFFGGIFLLLGLLTRVSAGALGITMIVAIASAKWDQVDSLETLLGFDETEYLALFLWLAIAGAGRFSVDRLLNRSLRA